MPSHLHPRSRLTTSLFGTTLLISFLVVGMPHILPCPAPRVAFADAEMSKDGRRRRIRRTSGDAENEEASEKEVPEITEDREMLAQRAHGCPVPKPSGVVGEVLGFAKGSKEREETHARSRIEIEEPE